MAKNRRVVSQNRPSPPQELVSVSTSETSLFSRSTGVRVATAMMAAMVVYVAYWTHDSIEVPQGAARYLVAWSIVAAAIAILSFEKVSRVDRLIDVTVWALAGWMGLSLLVNSAHANVRLGINELGWWIATASFISLARRVAVAAVPASTLLRLLMAVTLGISIYGWHQLLIGFPEMLRQYEQNPDAMLRQLGIESQGNSAMRIVFENRLRDGGPTGTFALANSMAAMLVGGFVAMVGWLAIVYRRMSRVRVTILVLAIAVVGFMILATRSRTAVVALMGVAAYAVLLNLTFGRKSRPSRGLRNQWFFGAALSVVVLSAVVVFRFGNSEWIQQAPASLLFRLRYWVACWRMFLDSPMFGVGPGQFKSAYELFRAEEASEQIADPHQFVLQTLTAGGLPAMAALLASLGLMFLVYRRAAPSVETKPRRIEDGYNSVTIGIGLSLVGVWIIGSSLGQLPSAEPALIATIFAAFFYWLLYARENEFDMQSDWHSVKKIAGYAAFAIGIDLLASGGITVPGVSVVAWTFLAIAAPVAFPSSLSDREGLSVEPSVDLPRTMAAGSLMLTALIWYAVGVLPIERLTQLQNRYASAWDNGQLGVAAGALEQAAQADRWDVKPLLPLVDIYRTMTLLEPSRGAEWKEKWGAAENEAAQRASRDPVVMRQLGDQRLLHYQRSADRKMLEAASRWYAKAVDLSPSHEAYAAQWAEVLRELGDPRAAEVARRAEKLSQAGGYYERLLDFTMIFQAKSLGGSESGLSGLVDARTVLAELLTRGVGVD